MNSKKRKKISPQLYQDRTYRQNIDAQGMVVSSYVSVKETDLHILAAREIERQALDLVYQFRNQLENYIAARPEFLTALVPIDKDLLAPPIVKQMLEAASSADVGPMAAVAGAIAEFVGFGLLDQGIDEIIGGDIFIKRNKECITSIFTGQSPLNQKLGIKIAKADMPIGVCTSSGTVGHSLSLGQADSVTVLAASTPLADAAATRSTPLADAAATRIGNEVSSKAAGSAIEHALDIGRNISGLSGVVIIQGEKIGAWGEINLVGLD
jgi:ApbE superfamily uncharacterized protein (UPF0280 family)